MSVTAKPFTGKISFSKLPSLPSFRGLNKTTKVSLSTGSLRLGDHTPRVLIIQNDLLCNVSTIISSLNGHNIEYKIIYAFHKHAFKLLHPLEYSAIIILGGKSDILNKQPEWLTSEMQFITNALKLNVPILGICLGCLLLAKCVGGTINLSVGDKAPEIGYKTWIYNNNNNMNSGVNINEEKQCMNTFNALALCENTNNIDIIDEKECIDTFESFHALTLGDSDNHAYNQLKYIGQSKSTPFCVGKLHVNSTKQFESTAYDNDEQDDEFIDFNEDELELSEDDEEEESFEYIEDDITKDLDPFIEALACQDMDRYILLFHNTDFKLPDKCIVSQQKIDMLAKTDTHNTLFRVGTHSYGIQALPQLNNQMLEIWCKCWSDKFFNQWDGNLETDVLKYAENNENKIQTAGENIFDMWCEDIVLIKRKRKSLHTLNEMY